MVRSWKEVKADKAAIDRARMAKSQGLPLDVGELIAALAPDVPWAADAMSSPAEIRERVAHFTSEQRATAEQEAIRAELPRPAAELAALADYYDERDTVDEIEAGLQAFLPLLARADAAGELPTP